MTSGRGELSGGEMGDGSEWGDGTEPPELADEYAGNAGCGEPSDAVGVLIRFCFCLL